MQRVLLLEIEELTNDNPEEVDALRRSVNYELAQALKPPVLTGQDNQLDPIRKAYRSNKIAMQLEHLPVNDQTPCWDYWEIMEVLNERYEQRTRKQDAAESI